MEDIEGKAESCDIRLMNPWISSQEAIKFFKTLCNVPTGSRADMESRTWLLHLLSSVTFLWYGLAFNAALIRHRSFDARRLFACSDNPTRSARQESSQRAARHVKSSHCWKQFQTVAVRASASERSCSMISYADPSRTCNNHTRHLIQSSCRVHFSLLFAVLQGG